MGDPTEPTTAAIVLPLPAGPPSRQIALPAAGKMVRLGGSLLSTASLTAIALLLLASYAALLAANGLTTSIAPVAAIVVSAGLASVAGFAFSAVSQALLAPLMRDPVQIVQVLMLCSITTQSYAIVSLWRHMDWRRLPVYLAGGMLGLPIGVYTPFTPGSENSWAR